MAQHSQTASTPRAWPLVLGAIGVVFGDIGTSPLYTMREAFDPKYGLAADHANVLGILSLVFWVMMLVVTIKYVNVIMRADNRGEGGILALMAVVQRSLPIAAPLGYKQAEIARMLKEAAPGDSAEDIIRKALKTMLRSG